MKNKRRRFEYFRLPLYIDKPIYYAIMTLAIFGFIMVVSASMGLAIGDNAYLIATGIKLILFTLVGYIGMVFMSRFFDFKILSSLMEASMVVTIILLMACLGFSGAGGAKAWIQIPIAVTEVTFQPSEVAKIVCVLCIANYLGDNKRIYRKPWNLIRYPAIFVLLCAFIILV
ncbi:MAG: FtsW/RodA/SpoVE family cell cycle protein, partial [Erysipelotrichaceae bacterium]|nr:FtsW/RodA/SpoVE family cell cycle protein [Erysipelotrichaceae bacterium]